MQIPRWENEHMNMSINSESPTMTIGVALCVLLMDKYAELEYSLSQLEIQKLVYFLQVSGEDLKLNFVPEKYGPYAENLNHVLQRIEGHFIRGYGDRSKGQALTKSLKVIPHAVETAREFIVNNEDAQNRLKRVGALIYGFETPYGLELLATTHWIVAHEPELKDQPTKVIARIHSWSNRKKELFSEAHINKALERLTAELWL
jgi:uncharacterized protein YwgA